MRLGDIPARFVGRVCLVENVHGLWQAARGCRGEIPSAMPFRNQLVLVVGCSRNAPPNLLAVADLAFPALYEFAPAIFFGYPILGIFVTLLVRFHWYT